MYSGDALPSLQEAFGRPAIGAASDRPSSCHLRRCRIVSLIHILLLAIQTAAAGLRAALALAARPLQLQLPQPYLIPRLSVLPVLWPYSYGMAALAPLVRSLAWAITLCGWPS